MTEETSYHGNPNLKSIGHAHEFTKDQITEYIKCQKDPIYFIENYCKIVSLDRGLVPFKLYPCQKKKVDIILNNRKVILMEGRQQGKCCEYSTLIHIKNTETGALYSIMMGDFYEWQRFCRWFKEFGSEW